MIHIPLNIDQFLHLNYKCVSQTSSYLLQENKFMIDEFSVLKYPIKALKKIQRYDLHLHFANKHFNKFIIQWSLSVLPL